MAELQVLFISVVVHIKAVKMFIIALIIMVMIMRGWGYGSVLFLEHLLNKCDAIGSIPSTTKSNIIRKTATIIKQLMYLWYHYIIYI